MSRRVEPWLIAALLGVVLLWGVALRLQDPLSTRALGAEDPYTHVVFTREWLGQGYFADSFHLGTTMYPPGMHAFVGAFAAVSGVSLYDFARIAPAIFGGLAILGMYALASRLANPAAGLAAAFLTAIMPEHIFRTELLFPTALDLALLPLWLLAFHLLLEGERVAGAVLFAGAAIPLAIMHPWAIPLFAAPLALYAALRALRAREPFGAGARALALPAGLLVAAVAFAASFRWDESGTGLGAFFAKAPGLSGVAGLDVPGPLLFLAILVALALPALVGIALVALAARALLPRALRLGLGIAAGAGLLALLVPLTRELPVDVSYGPMLGPIAIGAALVGFAIAFVRPTPLGDMGIALALVLFPLTALDPFDSPYWPHRTVAYLTIGVGLLGAVAAGLAYDSRGLLGKLPSLQRASGPAVIGALALLGVGAATAMPVDTYEWYRLYDETQFAGFERAAALLEEEPTSRVFVYGWQPALMVKTLADPDHVWYAPKFFQDEGERRELVDEVEEPAYVLIDPFTEKAEAKGKADLGFLGDDSRYRLVFGDGILLYEVIK